MSSEASAIVVDARVRKTPANVARALRDHGWDADAAYIAACAWLEVPGRGLWAAMADIERVRRVQPLDAAQLQAIDAAYRKHRIGR
jgi:hypothetical protein